MTSILLIGKRGQLSTYLQKVLTDDYQLIVLGRQQLDLTQLETIYATLESYRPSLIINPAAYTAVDQAESDSDAAYAINAEAVQRIAEFSQQTATPLIHVSTDYVFSGALDRPYTEEDAPDPQSVYGKSKLAGEQAILKTGAPAVILRTSWVYSNIGKNFYLTMLRLAQDRDELGVVADQFGAPTYAHSLAVGIRQVAERLLSDADFKQSDYGVYHMTCGGKTSWCEFASAILRANNDHTKVNPIATEAYPTPADRPQFSVLDNNKLKSVFDVSLPDWRDALQQCANETRAFRTGAA